MEHHKKKSSPIVSAIAFVIAAALVGIIFTLVRREVQRHNAEERDSARSALFDIEVALADYKKEYKRYPGPPGNDFESEVAGDLLRCLLGEEFGDPDFPNPNHSSFLVMLSYQYHDPWGNPFHVVIDRDSDQKISDPSLAGEVLDEEVIIWSGGRDRDPDTWEDNIRSW